MLKQKRLKKQLGEGYFFEQRLSAAVVKNLLDMLGGSNHFLIAACLTVGVVKLDAVVYWSNGKYSLGYDLMVKDAPDIFVRSSDDAYIGLNMMIHSNFHRKCYEITFDANVRRMGIPMTATDLGKLTTEVQQAQALLTALEMYRFQPTQKDMEQFHDYLLDRPQYGNTQPQQEQVNSEMVM